jgi:hypothetical protein
MCTVKGATVFGLLLAARVALAHPVAQGALDLAIYSDRIQISARVSTEQVLVASTAGPSEGDLSAEVMVRNHGEYLLRHFQLVVDGQSVAGQVAPNAELKGARSTNPLAKSHVSYELIYSLPARPSTLTLGQDVLRELDFAPGNPWEATYVVRIFQNGQTRAEALLLTHREPLRFTCDWTNGAAGSKPVTTNRWHLAMDYLRHGIMHILSGYDHLLFISALVLAVRSLWDLIKVVTAFTLAHTVTLTLSVLNVVRLPEGIVEPVIAASIVFVALENVFWPARTRGWTRLAVAFVFGLFHGLGFAGGLLDAMEGMAGSVAFAAIAAFSVGVEVGHQLVVIPLYCGLRLARQTRHSAAARDRVSARALRYGSALISLAGMFYLIAALRWL